MVESAFNTVIVCSLAQVAQNRQNSQKNYARNDLSDLNGSYGLAWSHTSESRVSLVQ